MRLRNIAVQRAPSTKKRLRAGARSLRCETAHSYRESGFLRSLGEEVDPLLDPLELEAPALDELPLSGDRVLDALPLDGLPLRVSLGLLAREPDARLSEGRLWAEMAPLSAARPLVPYAGRRARLRSNESRSRMGSRGTLGDTRVSVVRVGVSAPGRPRRPGRSSLGAASPVGAVGRCTTVVNTGPLAYTGNALRPHPLNGCDMPKPSIETCHVLHHALLPNSPRLLRTAQSQAREAYESKWLVVLLLANFRV